MLTIEVLVLINGTFPPKSFPPDCEGRRYVSARHFFLSRCMLFLIELLIIKGHAISGRRSFKMALTVVKIGLQDEDLSDQQDAVDFLQSGVWDELYWNCRSYHGGIA